MSSEINCGSLFFGSRLAPTFLALGLDLSDDFPVAVLAPMKTKLHGETGRLASTSLSVSEELSPSSPSEDSPTLPLRRITPGS